MFQRMMGERWEREREREREAVISLWFSRFSTFSSKDPSFQGKL